MPQKQRPLASEFKKKSDEIVESKLDLIYESVTGAAEQGIYNITVDLPGAHEDLMASLCTALEANGFVAMNNDQSMNIDWSEAQAVAIQENV